MLELARHYALVRSAHPTDRLLVVFEIDGPIVDQRHIVRRRLPDYATVARDVLAWCRKRASSTEHGHGTVRAYRGALEVIRWFQLKESTFVGLNTSRPERLRSDTLHSLNALGRDVRGPVPRRPAPHEPVGQPG